MTPFVHLHGHSHFSNGVQTDALSTPKALVEAAVAKGLTSICLTDHASITGVPALIEACKDAGIKPIIGSELYVTDDLAWRPADKEDKSRRRYRHLVALATNWDGFVELMGLLSTANEDDHFYYRARNSIDEVCATKHLIFTTACAGGMLAGDDWLPSVARLGDAVGAGRLYAEIQPHANEEQRVVNERALWLHREGGLPLVATQDFHYALEGQNVAHEVLLAVGQGMTWVDSRRMSYGVKDLFVKSGDEMLAAFAGYMRHLGSASTLAAGEVVKAFASTIEIGERCNVEWRKVPISLPTMSEKPDLTLMEKCVRRMKELGLLVRPDYVERLRYEFRVMQESGILEYFLVLEDVIAWSRRNGIMVGPGRGSSAGSLICYLIGITQVDPIKHDLLFERFYRPGRIDLPDIDTDFEDERREDVLNYIRERFGDEYVCGVSNYNKIGAKSAIRDACRVFDVSYIEATRATGGVEVDALQIDDENAAR